MKIERFFYGMINGKIYLSKTDGVTKILSDQNFQFLRKLTPKDNDQWWFPVEQVISVSHIEEVDDDDGRTWVQNQTLLIQIYDYIELTKPTELFQNFFEPILDAPPEKLKPINMHALKPLKLG